MFHDSNNPPHIVCEDSSQFSPVRTPQTEVSSGGPSSLKKWRVGQSHTLNCDDSSQFYSYHCAVYSNLNYLSQLSVEMPILAVITLERRETLSLELKQLRNFCFSHQGDRDICNFVEFIGTWRVSSHIQHAVLCTLQRNVSTLVGEFNAACS